MIVDCAACGTRVDLEELRETPTYKCEACRGFELQELRDEYRDSRPWEIKPGRKDAARKECRAAVADGRLIKKPCRICGTVDPIHAHHGDYRKPLEVTWLCPDCHDEMHQNELVDERWIRPWWIRRPAQEAKALKERQRSHGKKGKNRKSKAERKRITRDVRRTKLMAEVRRVNEPRLKVQINLIDEEIAALAEEKARLVAQL